MTFYRDANRLYEVRLEPLDRAQNRWRLQVGEQAYEVQVLYREGPRWVLAIGDRQVTVTAQWEGIQGWVTYQGRTYQVLRGPQANRSAAPGTGGGDGALRAPMPAQVRAVQVQKGQEVQAGQTLLVLEAMKMELRIQAPFDGVVQDVRVQAGDTVARDQLLAVVQPAADARP